MTPLLPSLLLLLLSILVNRVASNSSSCLSCFAQCPSSAVDDISLCDCAPNNRQNSNITRCEGEYCYATINRIPSRGIIVIEKGCRSHAPRGATGCVNVDTRDTVECICQGDACNAKDALSNYAVPRLPIVQCCQCDGLRDEGNCHNYPCNATCTGNYCAINFETEAQYCLWGPPRQWELSGTTDTRRKYWGKGSLNCNKVDAGLLQATTCTCSTLGGCNSGDFMMPHHLDWIHELAEDRTADDIGEIKRMETFCYDFQALGKEPLTENVWDRSRAVCTGDACFVSLSTVATFELTAEQADRRYNTTNASGTTVYRGQFFKLVAGCITVDDMAKVEVGCTSVYDSDSGMPQQKTCICLTPKCNYFYQLTGGDWLNLRSRVATDNYELVRMKGVQPSTEVFVHRVTARDTYSEPYDGRGGGQGIRSMPSVIGVMYIVSRLWV